MRIHHFLFSAFCLLPSAFVFAQGPDADWRTITTAHFRVHYPVQYEAWATRAASDIESVRAAVVKEVGFSPKEITDVLVMNPVAEANGATLPFLGHPRIVLFTDPPKPESQIGEFGDWIDLLTAHEMTHLVHLLRPSRNPMQRFLSRFLDLSPITLSAPRWVLEGYATLVEGRLTGAGRPNSSIRAAILRKWAVSGHLPPYSELSSDRRFLGMSMAYLAGSAYLAWLEQRGGPDSLQHLWARLTARQRRSFDQAFEGVFGDRPDRLYGQFTAELTERSMAVARLEEPSLREGELWQGTSRDSGDPAVSPDGSKIALVQRDAHGDAKLVVYSTGPNAEEEKFNARIERMLRRDPQDVPPLRRKPIPRKPLFTLAPPDGGNIQWPRWTRDGHSILYTHKQPDREGFLHHDLFLWTPSSHRNRRVTHLADVEDADPLPDGRAIAVRNRNGLSQLITINISTGDVSTYNAPSLERIYSHPRASSDGRIAWAEHDRSGWRVAVDGKAFPISGLFSPEWNGTQLYAAVASRGFIEIARVDERIEILTRTAGVATAPAPAPDGSLYFMSLEPDGFVVRRLPPASPALPALSVEQRFAPAVPPEPPIPVTFQRVQPPASREYRFGRQEIATLFGGSWTAYDHADEFGVRVGDVVGRLDAIALASTGHEAALAVTWRGWPVAVTGHLFRVGAGVLAGPAAGTPAATHGLELRGNYDLRGAMTLLSIEAGGVSGRGSRSFIDGTFTLRRKKDGGSIRIAMDSEHHSRAGARLTARAGGVGFAIAGEAGNRMTIGGVASSLTPDALLIERVIDPALPFGFSSPRRYRGARAEVKLSGVTAFWQRHSEHITVRGLTVSAHMPPLPLAQLPAFDLTAGVARVTNLRGTKGWLALRWQS